MQVRRSGYGGARPRSRAVRAAGIATAGAASAVAYAFFVRPRMTNWGATAEEVNASLPGDELVRDPDYVTTRAVTVNARPEDIWPWLMQVGYRRGGLYSYDSLDRIFGYLDRPSAEEILPEFQGLAVGDTIPVGRGPSWPVRILEPSRAFVMEPIAGTITWGFALIPRDDHATRLITRVRCRVEDTTSRTLLFAVIDPAAFVMTRKMLLNLKRRAEALARRHEGAGSPTA